MKSQKTLVPVALMMIMMAIASVASAQYYHEEQLDRFLDGHPKVRSELAQNPDLIYNKQWRDEHPQLRHFMQNHPDVWGKLPHSAGYGAYGPNHQWHEADWYHEHNPAMYQNHPEWAREHPNSAANSEHTEWSKHHEHEEAKEAKHRQQEEAKDAEHQQHEKANSEAKAERRHKHHGYGQN